MKTEIRYYTRSKKGNTKKLADAVSAATGIAAKDVSVDLDEKTDRLILINAMYAANIDEAVKAFLTRNKSKIGQIVNMNTSATGRSTIGAVKAAAQPLGIPVSDLEFHCAASWIFLNQGKPTQEDLDRAGAFAASVAGGDDDAH